MRKTLAIRGSVGALVAAGALLAVAGATHAAPVATDVVLTLDFVGDFWGAAPPVTFGGSGIVSVSGSTVAVPAGLVAITSKVSVPVTGTTNLASLQFWTGWVSNAAATFSLGGVTRQAPGEVCPGTGNNPAGFACNVGGGIGGLMPLTLTFIPIIVPMVVLIPQFLQLGQGGSTNHPWDVDAAAWSTGGGVVAGSGPTSTFTQGGGSPLTLVSPTFIGLLGHRVPLIATLTLSDVYLPEPSGLLLIGTGVAGLVLLRRRSR